MVPSPPPPVNPAIAEYPKMVVMEIAAPIINDGFDSGIKTLTIICQVDAPMDFAASITPASTSFKEDSTILAIYGPAAMTSGGITAFAPMVVPTKALVNGKTIISKIINGTARNKLMSTPTIILKKGSGRIPFLSVTTRKMPSGIPMT